MTATQVVDKMLEDFDFSGDHRPSPAGGPSDPWRQAGIKKLNFKAKDFLTSDPKKPAPGQVPIKKASPQKHAARFNWKPGEPK